MEPQDFASEPVVGAPTEPFVPPVAAPEPEPASEPAVAPEQLSSDVPSADNSDPIAADPALLEHIKFELDHHRDEVVARDVHTIEHRSFGRESADAPMPSTVITGA